MGEFLADDAGLARIRTHLQQQLAEAQRINDREDTAGLTRQVNEADAARDQMFRSFCRGREWKRTGQRCQPGRRGYAIRNRHGLRSRAMPGQRRNRHASRGCGMAELVELQRLASTWHLRRRWIRRLPARCGLELLTRKLSRTGCYTTPRSPRGVACFLDALQGSALSFCRDAKARWFKSR